MDRSVVFNWQQRTTKKQLL